MQNPPFNEALGAAALSAAPPFDFDGVVMRVFPLRASVRALTRFCDRYLNLMPPEIALFKPALPYVYLMAINYGRMGGEGSTAGWVSQIEVAFTVPLHWCRREDDRLVFQRWASVSPFIYVDEQSSLATGREVYGWPKSPAWLTPGINEWARSPRKAQRLFVLSAMVFPELFAGKRQEPRVLLEIERQPRPRIVELPPDPLNQLNPLLGVPQAIFRGVSVAGDLLQAVTRLPIGGYDAGSDRVGLSQLITGAGDYLDLLGRQPVLDTLNLKQFRDSRDANAVCYQAITCSPMTITRLNQGGLLGEPLQLRGDPSGGYRIQIHDYAAQPILPSLGLEVEEEADAHDHSVATLRPYFPFWADLDLHYGRGDLVCWRTKQIDWRTPSDAEDPAAEDEAPASEGHHAYNTAHGAAEQAITGPFRFPDATCRVLPLLADWFRLRQLCSEYLDNDFTFFEPWGSYVYLIATTFEEMSSETYNVGWWASRQVTFSFPVKWYKRHRPRSHSDSGEAAKGTLIGVAMVSPFAYTDSDLGATTGREVQGLPMIKTVIDSPPSAWLESSGPRRRSDLLRLETKVFTAFGADQEMEARTLLRITPRPFLPEHDEAGWKTIASNWGERLYKELFLRKEVAKNHGDELDDTRALALELLRGWQPINEISLRQFRDAEEPDRACYQALTLTRTTVEELFELNEIEEPLHVAIHRYPSQPIVQTLGLRSKWTDAGGSSVIDYLQPVRPFWARVAMRVDLGEDIFSRAGSETWSPGTEEWRLPIDELRRLGWDRAAAESQRVTPRNLYLVNRRPQVGRELVRLLDEEENREGRRDLRLAWRLWFNPRKEGLLGQQEAREALLLDLAREKRADRGGAAEATEGEARNRPPLGIDPQMVLESALSHEWGRLDRPEGRSRRLPEICVRSDTLAPGEVRRAFAERLRLQERDGYWFRSAWERRASKPEKGSRKPRKEPQGKT